VEELGARWHKGRVVLHRADPANQPKEVPMDVFFHKIFMIRNNLRVLEQRSTRMKNWRIRESGDATIYYPLLWLVDHFQHSV